jgi:hypothetical protein
MWKTMALIVAVLAPAAVPEIIPVGTTAPQRAPVRVASLVLANGQTFAPTCRGDQVLDSRPDPAWVGQSFVGDHCQAPSLPGPIDGARATRNEVVAAMARAKRYGVAAEAFQRCVSDFVAARRAHDAAPLTSAEIIIENHRVLVSQRAKERATAQANAIVNAFNQYGSDCPG